MDLQEFFDSVVPAGGKVILARPAPKTKPDGSTFMSWNHTVCASHEEAVAKATAMAEGDQNLYFALASYKQGFHQNAKGKKVVRVHENVQELAALWLDIDFKQGYADQKEAAVAVVEFCKASKMPPPSILVHSGNGLHVYWPFDTYLTVERWQRLSDALKEACKTLGLTADHSITADAARVLRVPGSKNWKDPANPKPVRILYSSGVRYSPDDLETFLLPFAAGKTAKVKAPKVGPTVNDDLGGGVGERTPAKPSSFAEIVKHCAASAWVLETKGEACSEPEWMAYLQLLKHCEDGADFAHRVSCGHPGYSESGTEDKWQARLANSAGPTLCKTFEMYRPEKCAKCPHNGFIKTPVQVGYEGMQDLMGLPTGWRVAPDEKGIERLMLTDPVNNVKEWIRMFRHIPSNFRPVKSIATGQFDMLLDIRLKDTESWTVTLPMTMLGNHRKMVETLAGYGVVLNAKEVGPFGELMARWLEKIQNARRVADVTDQLGWIYTGDKLTGFATSPTVYHSDGRIRNDVRPSREFTALAKLYEPRGDLEEWKRVAKFVTDQNHPALTAVLAAAFAAPLLKFVGIEGGTLSLVSTASGVGKSSVLKLSQAVWGSPVHAMNSVDDTQKSVAKKIGFLNNLPAYWDELRGRQTVDGFANLAFQLTQGREKSRLGADANLRESITWETMLTVASNESIFEAMARRTTGSDAGMVRVFELEMTEAPKASMSSAEITLLFETLKSNYGHAGRVYAQYLATHVDEIRTAVQSMYLHIGKDMQSQDRFWVGITALLLVGAAIAKNLGLCNIQLETLRKFLITNTEKLRGRTTTMSEEHTMVEIFADYLRDRGDRMLIIDKFHNTFPITGGLGGKTVSNPRSVTLAGRPPKDYLPEIKESPRSEKAAIVYALDDKLIRFSTRDFMVWLAHKELPTYGAVDQLIKDLQAKKMRCALGIGTRYAGPRVNVMEVSASWADLSSPARTPDSSTDPAPAS